MKTFTSDEIENLIQRLYAWAEKRETINRKRVDVNPLQNDLIRNAIYAIQYLRSYLPENSVEVDPEYAEKLRRGTWEIPKKFGDPSASEGSPRFPQNEDTQSRGLEE